MARADCKAALEITPDNKNAQFNLGLINFDEQRYVAAEANFMRICKSKVRMPRLGACVGKYASIKAITRAQLTTILELSKSTLGRSMPTATGARRINVEKFDRAEKTASPHWS